VNVTPRILIFCTRFSPSNVSGMLNLCFFRLSTKTIYSLLLRFRERLLEAAQSDICWSSLDLVLTLAAGIIR